MAILHHDPGPRRPKSSKEKEESGKHGGKPARKPSLFGVLKEAASEWSADKCSRLAAALSYYTIFSIAPLLVIAIAVAGFVFGQEAASNQIFGQIRGFVGDTGAQAIQGMVQAASNTGAGVIATVVGVATLLLGASGAIGQLQDALNTIWEVKPKPGQGIKAFLRHRLLSFSMVLVIAFFLMVSLVVSAALTGLGVLLERILPVPAVALQAINIGVAILVTSLLFVMMFKVLPDVEMRWKDVWIGGLVTAILFSVGRYLIGLYLGRGSVTGVFGAEFTQVYANRRGSKVKPSPHAEPLTGDDRANQGLKSDPDGRGRPPKET
ncbi:MAG TPA: YihY/virulence factor BrkB family protein [Fibrobacteria bacterium]|nr:YihY/virulence factor BrkB family protein [Fibrobacteria bacterium]